MEQDDGKEERSQADSDLRHTRSSTLTVFASGGLSLEDFQQSEWLKHFEMIAQFPDLPGTTSDLDQLERAARKNFRRHHDREEDRANIRNWQTVADGNGRRGGGRDGWNRPAGDAFPCDGTDLFGLIRPENSRHPKRTSSNRARTPLQQLIERLVDEGLTGLFLEELTKTIKARALQDTGLVRYFALLVSEAGFDIATMLPVKEVDDDLMLRSGDNKRIAEQLTDYGLPSTVRDVENSKKRLDRALLQIGAQFFGRRSNGKGSKE